MNEDSGSALQLARRLAAEAGLPLPDTASPLSGGKNNRTFRAGDDYVLKVYHWDPRDPRDRLRAEWRFLSYAVAHGVSNVPRPLAQAEDTHAALYSLLPGRTLQAGEVTAAHVDAALDFLLAVNAVPREVLALGPGSEACFSLDEHIATIERRVARLATIDPSAPRRAAAEALIRKRLRPAWDKVSAALSPNALSDRLGPEEQCISPSDFGFHNALVSRETIGFIDFEYAGRDDPAKLVCDFFCQPEVPVPIVHMAGFLRRLMAGLGLDARHEARAHSLLDAYRVKWACIILNDFLPLGSARRAHANLERSEERAIRQLARAEAKLDEIGQR
jgi:hypothetical protein